MAKRIKRSIYKGVHWNNKIIADLPPWRAELKINGESFRSHHWTEREAAIAYDTARIKNGMEPVNILKPKTT